MKPAQQNWKARAEALLLAIQDVAPKDHPKSISREKSGRQYIYLFEKYVSEFQKARDFAIERWESMIEIEAEELEGDREEAARSVDNLNPGGTVSDAVVIGTIRKYWLACHELNQSIQNPAQRVPPEDFLLRWLLESKYGDLAQFLSGLTYWPIGLNKEGNWV